jgi:hypothetical protein
MTERQRLNTISIDTKKAEELQAAKQIAESEEAETRLTEEKV